MAKQRHQQSSSVMEAKSCDVKRFVPLDLLIMQHFTQANPFLISAAVHDCRDIVLGGISRQDVSLCLLRMVSDVLG